MKQSPHPCIPHVTKEWILNLHFQSCSGRSSLVLFNFALQLMFCKSSLSNIFLCHDVPFVIDRIRDKIKQEIVKFIRLIVLKLVDYSHCIRGKKLVNSFELSVSAWTVTVRRTRGEEQRE
jgi:hypothetical protein